MYFYDLAIHVEEIQDGGDYRDVAASPDLPGVLGAGDTAASGSPTPIPRS